MVCIGIIARAPRLYDFPRTHKALDHQGGAKQQCPAHALRRIRALRFRDACGSA